MKRLSHLGFVGLLAALAVGLAGCPVFSDGGGGNWGPGYAPSSSNGAGGGGGSGGGNAVGTGCTTSATCGVNETCGSDGQCHTGDCTIWGCSAGNVCIVDPTTHIAACQPSGQSASSSTSTGGGSGGGSSTSSSSGTGTGAGGSTSTGTGTGGGSSGSGGAAPTVWCGNPGDCAAGQTCAPDGTCHAGSCTLNAIGCIYGYTCSGSGTCARTVAGCDTDADCANAGAGYACVSGVCTAPSNQCWDGSQCTGTTGNPADGNSCVSGKCIDACKTSADCPPGEACDAALGVCSLAATPCKITNDCDSATLVCVAGACVPRSSGATCPSGYVWVDNGCIPNQNATFVCGADGPGSGQGTLGQVCNGASTCLHHGCYISCQTDPTACVNQTPSFSTCESVTSAGVAYQVCGSSTNLGSQCDPATACTGGKVCIDGYCK